MIGERFRAYREAAGMDQQTATERLALAKGTLSRIETGYKMPSVALVVAAAKLYGCTTDALILDDKSA